MLAGRWEFGTKGMMKYPDVKYSIPMVLNMLLQVPSLCAKTLVMVKKKFASK
jgi:hypothetical protein